VECPPQVRLAEETVKFNHDGKEYDEYFSLDKLDQSNIQNHDTRLALLLMELKISNDPYWAPYIGTLRCTWLLKVLDSLPDDPESLLYWSDTELLLLEGSEVKGK
jgi:hypothetical protein